MLAMDINAIGTIIKNGRTACGLSQNALAAASHISRVTISNLESGRVGDIGALKLAEIAENIGLPLFSRGKPMDCMKLILSNINTSYAKAMTVADLEKFVLHGEVLQGFEGQILHLLDETPTALISGSIKQIAEKKKIPPKKLWKNLAQLAKKIQSPNQFWNAVA